MTLNDTINNIRERVDPSPAEQQELEDTTNTLRDRVAAELEERDVSAEIVQTGSTARGTYVTGDRDIDLFICFPPSLSEQELEAHALEIGKAVLPDGREEYASHPYVKGTFNDFDVDLVPCYNIDDASDLKSAVDRTPFHTQYLEPKFDDELASDVRVAKFFLKQLDIYGSDDKTEGFSGYLTELMVLEAGGFAEFLEMVSNWGERVFIDRENHIENPEQWILDHASENRFYVVDPVDPDRNVSDIVSDRQRARLQHHARKFLANPSLDQLDISPEPQPIDELSSAFEQRDTAPVAVVFDRPDLLDETLIPQLKRSLDGMVRLLNTNEFDVLRSDWLADEETAVLFAEVTPAERAAVTEQRGPPVHLREAAENFINAHPVDEEAVYVTDDGRYAVETNVEHQTPTSLLDEVLVEEAAHGAAIDTALESGYDVVRLDIFTRSAGDVLDTFQSEFSTYLNPSP